jgi:hypothetical protein
MSTTTLLRTPIAKQKKSWTSTYYGFFDDNVKIRYTDEKWKYLVFTCIHPRCHQTIKHFTDTGDASSTGALKKHVEESCKCWGPGVKEVVAEAKQAKTVMDSRKVAEGYIKTGCITHHFERKKGQVTYSIMTILLQNSGMASFDYCHLL